jgi:hypothetical protein
MRSVILRQSPKSLLVLGVYHGRDICLIGCTASENPEKAIEVIGIDKFSDSPCDDWDVEKRKLSWEEAGFGEAPSIEKARSNIERFRPSNMKVGLVISDDAEYLSGCKRKFDAIYIDTSHDYDSVKKIISLCGDVCSENGVIFGDDYEGNPKWGVKKAVSELFADHSVHESSVWVAMAKDLKK